MKDGISITLLRDIINSMPTHDSNGNPLMIRLAGIFSKFYIFPHYIKELAIIEYDDRKELLLVPDIDELDFGGDDNSSSLADLVLEFCTCEMQCGGDFDDFDFDRRLALQIKMYHAALAVKKFDKQL